MPRRDDHPDRDPRRRHPRHDPYDRDEEGGGYGQYGDLSRGLGYGGGRDLDRLEGFGRGRDPDHYPRAPRYTEGGWRDPDTEAYHAGGRPRGRGERRGWTERATDEVASWFGDEGARRRREADHRGKGPRGYRRSDERIRDDVCDRLIDDPEIDATDITVTVREGEVTLDGHVDSRWARRAAEDCAEAVSGVQHVQNNLRVRPARDAVTPPPQGGGTA
jgi:hypothetical protein